MDMVIYNNFYDLLSIYLFWKLNLIRIVFSIFFRDNITRFNFLNDLQFDTNIDYEKTRELFEAMGNKKLLDACVLSTRNFYSKFVMFTFENDKNEIKELILLYPDEVFFKGFLNTEQGKQVIKSFRRYT